MRYALIIVVFLVFIWPMAKAQTDIVQALKDRYDIPNGLEADLKIEVEVPGINIPAKSAHVLYEKGKASKITGKGLLFFPKKGLMEEFQSILNEPHHIIPLEETEEKIKYKMVSLDQKSDWVTADIVVSIQDPRIESMLLTTRKNGDFDISHHYGDGPYPIRTQVQFESERFSIPLKFMGKKELIPEELEGKNVSGKIVISYSNVKIY